jgi:uncharacterized protein DUF1153
MVVQDPPFCTVMMRHHPKQRKSLQLPPASGRRRWGPRAKAAVVIALRSDTLRRSEAYERYQLSAEELAAWEAAFDRDGIAGLQASALAGRNRCK